MRHEAIVIGGGATPGRIRRLAGEVALLRPRAIPKPFEVAS